MGTARHFRRGGGGVFTCLYCGRQTRLTNQAHGSEACEDCYELGGIHNALTDGEDIKAYANEIRGRCANITAKGGKLDSDALELLEAVKEVPQ